MDISVWIQGYNEERNLPQLFAPLKGIEDIVFIDHQSTDKSAQLAKELGARVYTRAFLYESVQTGDVQDFTNRFGYEPHFKTGEQIPLCNKERTIGQSYCHNDWVLNLDCDEVLTWDYEKVKEILPLYDCINCKYYHIRNPDRSRTDWFQTLRLYNRKKTFWIGRMHEVINGYNLRIGWTNDMEIDHFQVTGRDRSANINVLEYSVLKDQDVRSFFYLGKEYHHNEKWEKAINILILYLKEGYYEAEKVKAYVMIADSMWQLGREDEAFIYAAQALKINPDAQEVYQLFAKISPKRHENMWVKHAQLAVNDHLI